jgi:ABC-type sugar transport system ATPase subunit
VKSSPHIVEIAGVTRRFPGVLALDHIHVSFRAGEVHAVVGENGAGKSTLMHILAGDLQPSEVEILIDGKATHFASPLDSRAAGIVVVYQELALCPTMTIAENVVMSDMARRRVASLVPRAMMRAEARAALASIRCGMALVPADRRGAGALLAMTVADNVVSASLKRFSVAGMLQRAAIRREAGAQVARLDARIARLGQKLGTLSGGNQQKIILGRSLVTHPRVRHRRRRQGRDLRHTPRDRR